MECFHMLFNVMGQIFRYNTVFSFHNSAFVSPLEPNDQVMADRGFKAKEDSMMVQARFTIPPNTCGNFPVSRCFRYS